MGHHLYFWQSKNSSCPISRDGYWMLADITLTKAIYTDRWRCLTKGNLMLTNLMLSKCDHWHELSASRQIDSSTKISHNLLESCTNRLWLKVSYRTWWNFITWYTWWNEYNKEQLNLFNEDSSVVFIVLRKYIVRDEYYID